ncbi:hypothetical protein EGW08_010444 [Elysia chlorotica]|uniref:3'-5' exonuclease n=1 Tax=Elysia chlorotica TaxID=188477 RepID=A0A3S1BIU7_ELYCH|nr:hypothetical protein EGW08_010444 [Elysia chlorotica]
MTTAAKAKKRSLPQWMVAVKEQQERDKPFKSPQNFTDSLKVKKVQTVEHGVSKIGCQSASDIISEDMPWLKFEGSITYSYHESDCACICQDILSRLGRDLPPVTVIGFDTEWPVTYNKGLPKKTAVIQMCLSKKECYLFHVSCMSTIPKPLQSVILDKRVILVGVNIESDLWKLERDYDLKVKPAIDQETVVDLSKLANVKLKSSERWSLDGLCRNVLRKRLDKDRDLRCGNWDDYPLSKDQKMYASNDAFASLELYTCLASREKS